MAQYLKGILAAVAAIANILVAWLPAGPVTGAQWAQIAIGIVAAVAVYLFPNAQSRGGKIPSQR